MSSWFDSAYYHILYAHRSTAEAEHAVRTLLPHLNLEPGMRVFDLGCGRGRHAWPIAEQGVHVTGMDLGADNIAAAQDEATRRGVTEHTSFVVGDMLRDIPQGPFDAILNWFTSFGFFEDMATHQDIIIRAAEQLKPGGIIRFDFMNIDQVRTHLIAVDHKIIDGIHFTQKRRIDGQWVIKDIVVNDQGTEHQFQERVLGLSEADFHRMYRAAGLDPVNTWGDYDGRSFSPSSPRMITGAKKPA